MRTLLFDIETTPLTGYTWGTWQQNVIEVEEEWSILSVAWKWLGESGRPQFCRAYADGTVYDLDPVSQLHELFDEADIVVAHNAVKFDVPKARARMAFYGFEPTSPFRVVDTLRIARSEFAFTSNRLDDLCAHLGLGRKLRHQGFGLWKGCMAGDDKAWATMERYNVHDVVLLERLYKRLRPWSPTHPTILTDDKPDACPKCGATRGFKSNGWRYYKVTKRRAFRCKANGCIVYGRSLEKLDVTHVA